MPALPECPKPLLPEPPKADILVAHVLDREKHAAHGRLRGLARAGVALAGLGLLLLLVIAARLHPAPEGRGTHQQLGLPPCSFVVLTGWPCPTCGMTTAWTLLVHGRPLAALRANAGGVLLAVAAACTGPWLLLSGLRGTWCGTKPPMNGFALAAVLTALVTLIQWVARLSFG
ncbi:MAG: DUF2752 domain-containing protein [Planctomycetota bacterium]